MPISYENACRSCHPLGFDGRAPRVQVPHGIQPREVVAWLRDRYRAEATKDVPALLELRLLRRPGRSLAGLPPPGIVPR